MDVHGIEGSTFDAIDMEFYYPSEHIADPLGIGKNYKVEEISQMLEDLEEFSILRDQNKDKQDILSEKITTVDGENTNQVVYNVIVAECLRGIVFNELGDHINLCLKLDGPHKPS